MRLAQPDDAPVALTSGSTVALGGFAFKPDNVVLKVGDTLKWKFEDAAEHNLTFASGPRAIAGQTGAKGMATSTTFDTPGRYQLFCYLHPMTMREQVTVLPN